MYKKHDLPKKEDLVICTITEATPSSVFVTLDEYDKVTGMVHVSEISRKFVRGMKTYLKTVVAFKTLIDGFVIQPFFILAGQYVFYNSPWVVIGQINARRAYMITCAAS